ncbi:MAG: hypothetical protein DLM66_08310 [Candidatus Dormiibacter spiritus]|nr:MAG: hypothetical protein DLM66_08310 [Candidatus Dormibacteraeota bacterium]
MASMAVRLQRVYTESAPGPGKRVLVDRVWPRGVKKDALRLDLWLRDLGPSNELRKWFGHRAERWPEFQRRYREELEQPFRRELLSQLAELAQHGPLTLLYGARDEERNQAVVLRALLEEGAES